MLQLASLHSTTDMANLYHSPNQSDAKLKRIMSWSLMCPHTSSSMHFFLDFSLVHCDVNPLPPMSDKDRIFPYNINQIIDEKKEKY